MGPGAYPHCASASEDRLAAGDITSRDSTQIADVITAGVTYKLARFRRIRIPRATNFAGILIPVIPGPMSVIKTYRQLAPSDPMQRACLH
jgi:hypothetical protein